MHFACGIHDIQAQNSRSADLDGSLRIPNRVQLNFPLAPDRDTAHKEVCRDAHRGRTAQNRDFERN